jgi:hypothetical protein
MFFLLFFHFFSLLLACLSRQLPLVIESRGETTTTSFKSSPKPRKRKTKERSSMEATPVVVEEVHGGSIHWYQEYPNVLFVGVAMSCIEVRNIRNLALVATLQGTDDGGEMPQLYGIFEGSLFSSFGCFLLEEESWGPGVIVEKQNGCILDLQGKFAQTNLGLPDGCCWQDALFYFDLSRKILIKGLSSPDFMDCSIEVQHLEPDHASVGRVSSVGNGCILGIVTIPKCLARPDELFECVVGSKGRVLVDVTTKVVYPIDTYEDNVVEILMSSYPSNVGVVSELEGRHLWVSSLKEDGKMQRLEINGKGFGIVRTVKVRECGLILPIQMLLSSKYLLARVIISPPGTGGVKETFFSVIDVQDERIVRKIKDSPAYFACYVETIKRFYLLRYGEPGYIKEWRE